MSESTNAGHRYEFGPFRLDPVKRVLLRDGEQVPLTPKAFETLLVLIQNSGRVMEKEELLQILWPDAIVEEINLAQNISMLRKALGDSPAEHRYIVTIPGRGYRLVARVTCKEEAEAAPLTASTEDVAAETARRDQAVTQTTGATALRFLSVLGAVAGSAAILAHCY